MYLIAASSSTSRGSPPGRASAERCAAASTSSRTRATLARIRSTPRLSISRAKSDLSLEASGPCDSRLPSGGLALAAVGEESLVADRARLGVGDARHAGGEQLLGSDRAQVDVLSSAIIGSAPGVRARTERGVHLLADLVAADACTGPDDGLDRARRASLPQCAN